MKSQPAVVRFDNLVWVYAQNGLPQVTAQGTVVPLPEMCDLFAARCTVLKGRGQAQLELAGRRFTIPLITVARFQTPYARLGDLALPLNFRYVWDARSRTVNVTRTQVTPNGLSKIKGQAAGFDTAATTLQAPVTVANQVSADGFVSLNIRPSTNQPTALTVFAKALDGTLVTTGDTVRSSVDVKSTGRTCKTITSTQCSVTFNGSLYALAVFSEAKMGAK